jgi:Flp pilus assembly protein TadB
VVNDRLRIGDAEREAAARELGEHFALGRIDADEHAERLEQIWAARTAADLAPAFRDLPRSQATRQPPRPAASAQPVRREPGWQFPRVPFPFKLLMAIVVVWWGFHHPLFLVVGVLVYVLVVRRFLHRRRWHRRPQAWGHNRYHAGWH